MEPASKSPGPDGSAQEEHVPKDRPDVGDSSNRAASRRCAGTGLIKNTRRDGSHSWSFRYYDAREGRTVWGETFETEDEADLARLKARLASKNGSRRSGTLTVAGFAENWPHSHPEGRGASTLSAYKYGVRRFVDAFGSVKLRKLKRSECKQWASKQKRWAIAPAQAMLHDMWDDELITSNPLAKIKLPPEPGRNGYPILSTEEVWRLIDIARTELDEDVARQISGIIATSAFLGTRISETLALGRSAVDISDESILIDRQVAGPGKFSIPKGKKPRRKCERCNPRSILIFYTIRSVRSSGLLPCRRLIRLRI